MCSGCAPLHPLLATLTVLVLAFDVATNWYTFARFLQESTEDDADQLLYIFFGIAASFGTILWFLSIRNMVFSCKACGGDNDDKVSVAKWEESTSFFQLILQDTAMVVLVYVGYNRVSCTVYRQLYIDSFTAELALIGALSGSVWKIVRGIFNCLCCCMAKPNTGCGWDCFCFIFRIVTGVLAIAIIGFVIYQLVIFNDEEIPDDRLICYNGTTTVSPSP